MKDPIGSFLRIKALYRSYLDTAFRIADPAVASERRRLLDTPGTLCTDPLIEPIPRYRPHGLGFHDLLEPGPGQEDPLIGFSSKERRAFLEIVLAGLFPSPLSQSHLGLTRAPEFKPYSHQVEMLSKGTRPGSPGIVTSGTGSGKTESFLLPILATICKEAISWPQPRNGYLKRRWWHDSTGTPYEKYTDIRKESRASKRHPLTTPFLPHRLHEARPAAVRALVLYPMNALVEDQLVRLRKALDSREVREAMDREFAGNRIFFGRYTSATPTTGHATHPGLQELMALDPKDPRLQDVGPDGITTLESIREAEFGRCKRRQEELFDKMRDLEADQTAARRQAMKQASSDITAASVFGDETPFMFPSTDGGELLSRQDMQITPPDILITNISMLSAMLTREVDSPIFERTREWLKGDDSYFFLVLDELHLQRGSAGTEVCYLIRLLLDRLGLVEPSQRQKLRILASSASLPAAGPESVQSREYLWDMFGRFGLPVSIESADEAKECWERAIVAGEEIPPQTVDKKTVLQVEPFLQFLEMCTAERGSEELADTNDIASRTDLWDKLASALGVSGDIAHSTKVRSCVENVGSRLAAACWSEADQRTRATNSSELVQRIFGTGQVHDASYERKLDLARSMLIIRGVGDQDKIKAQAPSFRIHTFFRSIEGLYAPAWRDAGIHQGDRGRKSSIGALSIEREDYRELDVPEGGSKILRTMEALYCECCGELFFGGLRPKTRSADNGTELLPYQPVLEGLPDKAVSQNFEERSLEDYCVFWPTERTKWHPNTPNSKDPGRWIAATLNRETGLVTPNGLSPAKSGAERVAGFVYSRTSTKDKHGRGNDGAETHVPYTCPKCNTSYYARSRGMGRLSPVRNFRTGFGKTTQLLATELFDAQRVSSSQAIAKLVSFSDSRQDAAKASLDIETNHHQDLRRELLFAVLESQAIERVRESEELSKESDALQTRINDHVRAGDYGPIAELANRLERVKAALDARSEHSIALSEVVEVSGTELSKRELPVSRFVGSLISKGVHPFDEAGIAKVVGHDVATNTERSFSWTDMFRFEETVTWRDDPKADVFLLPARTNLIHRLNQSLSEVLFSKTYYSPEESGLGYVAVSALRAGVSSDRAHELAALVRVLTDSYRYFPSPYLASGDAPPPWVEAGDIQSGRVNRFAEAVWGESRAGHLDTALAQLQACGHPDGVVQISAVRVKLAAAQDPFWRCDECSRVHLHRGLSVCTRCFSRLPEMQSGEVRELWDSNFLARRVRRALKEAEWLGTEPGFRLHCEELTGQTDDPARRQREFRGIFLERSRRNAQTGQVEASRTDTRGKNFKRVVRARDTIDLLAVTTTMEVGIDIGPLQVVMQANMPPQRFNYQQRVGRAGRRGQAFSMVLTVCRTKSHDLYYFRSPEKITGDVPPPPFLSKSMLNIAERFLRKRWLVAAFELIRREYRQVPMGIYPGDLMTPPDIHGEFVSVETIDSDPLSWRLRLQDAMERTETTAQEFWRLLAADGKLADPSFPLRLEDLHHRVFELLASAGSGGIAGALAELGLFPMFGMPTRIRNLYLQIRRGTGGDGYEVPTIDRDLDVAIYEFAPGAVVVKDKMEHLCVGFTADFDLPKYKVKNDFPVVFHQDRWYRTSVTLLQCAVCSAWTRVPIAGPPTEKCEACDSALNLEKRRTCIVPNGFRTDFRPSRERDEPGAGMRHRSVQAEGRKIPFVRHDSGDGASVLLALDDQAVTYRLNRGPSGDHGYQFDLQVGSQLLSAASTSFLFQNQAVIRGLLPDRADFRVSGTEAVWLAAPKTTDSLYLSPSTSAAGLALYHLPCPSDDLDVDLAFRWQGIRAAALSASSMLAGRAALELDIDPQEFEILEPRLMGGETPLPVLQLTDELINGAGFCKWLYDNDPNGVPRVLPMIQSMLGSDSAYPRNQFLSSDHEGCDSACYRCLLRYDNQRFHGLLDWRLGLAYLRALTTPQYRCGLDGDFSEPELKDWCAFAARLAKEMTGRFGGEVHPALAGTTKLTAFRINVRKKRSPWVLIVHPLWDELQASPSTWGDSIVSSAVKELVDAEGCFPLFWDTFNLSRRRVDVSERIKSVC